MRDRASPLSVAVSRIARIARSAMRRILTPRRQVRWKGTLVLTVSPGPFQPKRGCSGPQSSRTLELAAAALNAIAARIASIPLLSLLVVGLCEQAFAYRPFDGTDAAVAGPGTVEIEIEPAGYLQEKSERTLVAPSLRLNYGLTENWEAVLEGQWAHGLSAGAQRSSLVSNGAFLKGVIRDGSLQDGHGPSLATELGLLLPGVNDEQGAGGSIAGIASQQWSWLTVHLNAAAAVTRRRHGDLFFSIIAEGPHDWTVRPVAEISYEREFGGLRATSGLIGAIWQVRDNVAVDVGFRAARINDHTLNEVRAGLTFSFAVR